uniref:Uncharacterized protein n=1 Tax=Microcebus murinus TaxID=30608 RepID=A0A8C5XFJ9_MICMU
MAHYKAAISKRECWEKSGALNMLTKVLVALYEEPKKPSSAVEFLKHHLGALLCLELAEMKEKNEPIVEENKKVKAKLAQYELPQEEKYAE